MYLAIDASTMTGSAAVFEGDRLLGERTVTMKGVHEERLMPAVVDLVTAHGGWGGLEALVVGDGPGSFTSLRIAAAIAKGIATALGVSLNVVPSLGLLVAAREGVGEGRYLATLDAMRGEMFAALVEVGKDGRLRSVGPMSRVAAAHVDDHAARFEALVVGAAGARSSEGGQRPVDPSEAPGAWAPHARGAGRLVAAGLARVVDLAAWEPDYGRLAEAQVKWEAEHGRSLVDPSMGPPGSGPTTAPADGVRP
jgi:tRNA threonylcarbamoyladenosine biosynthesis protein TsaB